MIDILGSEGKLRDGSALARVVRIGDTEKQTTCQRGSAGAVAQIEQLLDARLQARAGRDDLGRQAPMAVVGQTVALDELAGDADRRQLGPGAVFDFGSLV